jgi:hypothetical protein
MIGTISNGWYKSPNKEQIVNLRTVGYMELDADRELDYLDFSNKVAIYFNFGRNDDDHRAFYIKYKSPNQAKQELAEIFKKLSEL